MRIWIIFALTLVMGCDDGVIDRPETPENNSEIVDAEKGSRVAVKLDLIGSEVITQNNLYDAGCAISSNDSEGYLFMARMEDAHLILDGKLVALTPLLGEEVLPYGVSTHYEGFA